MKLSLFDRVVLGLARVEPSGLSPWAPGTCGSAVAILLAPWLFMPFAFAGRLLILAVLFVLGSLACGRAEQILGQKDPSSVVIDEVLGQWITILPFAALSWPELIMAFGLFRIFDITKPWPIHASESWIPGGWSVMLDDAFAGVYAMGCLWLIKFAIEKFQ